MQTSLSDAQEFLARVLPWPQDEDGPAYCNIHWTYQGEGYNKPRWSGHACADVREAIRSIEWALGQPGTRDIYFCTSSQRTYKERVTSKGNVIKEAFRNQENAVSLKALFLDIDCKDGGYSSGKEASHALAAFCKAVDLPTPSFVVFSGGGLHVYWTLARALTPEEWRPLAFALAEATKKHGLKCDTQCTIDCARVLRVPQTFNRKRSEPKPVILLHKGEDYSVERLERALAPYKTVAQSSPLPPRPPLQGISDLAAGIEIHQAPPVSIREVAKQCKFIGNAIITGGKDYDNTLWNLTTLIATFTVEGRPLAHLMAKDHPTYTVEETDRLFDRKLRERTEKNLGWPSCQTISASGCTACQSCPHFHKGKSPLNLAHFKQPTPVTFQGNQTTPPVDDLPSGYSRRSDGIILEEVELEDGTTKQVPICNKPMTDPWLQRNPWILHFTTTLEKTGKPDQIALPCEVIGTPEMRKVLNASGLVLGEDIKRMTRFLVAWIEKLQTTRNSVQSTPFGWSVKGGVYEGFTFGGYLWMPNGASRPAANPDPVIARQYSPSGELQPWIDAAQLVTSQGRPALDAVIAASFGAPLVRFTGQQGLLMSLYSMESGIGKSTAMHVAQAVWGDPIRGIQSLTDTQNSVLNKIGQLQSLPIFWDELKTEEDTKRFVNLVFQLSGGKEKSRMTARVTQRDVGTWNTLLCCASNDSLLDFVTSRTRMTTAGLYRVFEYEVEPGREGQIDPSEAQRIIARLNDNFGVVGLEYAKWLGANFAQIDVEVGDFLKDLGQEVGGHNDERFWLSLITVILLGARYANQLGFTDIDEDRLKEFMLDVLARMRAERAGQPIDMKDSMNVSNVLAQFLKAMRKRHTLVTNRIHLVRGKVPGSMIRVLNDVSHLESVSVHWGKEDKVLRISSTALSEWLESKGLSRHLFIRALEDQFGMRATKARLGSGTSFACLTEYVLEIHAPSSALSQYIEDDDDGSDENVSET